MSLDWLRPARRQNVGPVTFAELIRRYDSPGKALEAPPGIAAGSARGD